MSNTNDTTAIFSDGEMRDALASPEQKAAEKPAALVVIEGAFKTTIFELKPGEVTVGRRSDNSNFLNCKRTFSQGLIFLKEPMQPCISPKERGETELLFIKHKAASCRNHNSVMRTELGVYFCCLIA